MRKLLLLGLVTGVGLASWVFAQETATKPTPTPTANTTNQPSDGGYLPSEEISEDLSVSFPVDI